MICIILVYHGTIDKYADDILKNGVNLEKSKPHLDFGPGFYTTPNKDFAINTAKQRMKRYNTFRDNDNEKVKWKVLTFELDEEKLERLKCKTFTSADEEWGKFILANRCSNQKIHSTYDNNVAQQYDVITGPTADGKGTLTPIVEEIDSGGLLIDDVDFSKFAPSQNSNWSEQISFHSEESLSCIRLKDML